MYFTTLDIARITSSDNFNFGDNIILNKTNVSGERNRFRLELRNPSLNLITKDVNSNSLSIALSQEQLDELYKRMIDNSNLTVRVYIDTIRNSKTWSVYKDIMCIQKRKC